MSIKKILYDWTVIELEIYQNSYDVTEHVVLRWMEEAGLRYENYFVAYYKCPYVISDRKSVIIAFSNKLLEYSWGRFSNGSTKL